MLTVSLPPHIGTGQKLQRWQAVKALAVLPLLLAAMYIQPLSFGPGLLGALLGMAVPSLIFRKWRYCRQNWGECLFGSSLIALLIPGSVPWYFPLVAGLLASVGRLMLSEMDHQPPLNFIALVMAVFVLATPERIRLAYHWTWDYGAWARGNFHFMSGWLPYVLSFLILAVLGRGLYKLLAVITMAMAALLVLGLSGAITNQPSWNPAFQSILLLSILLASDNPYTPLSRTGQFIYSTICGGFFGLFAIKNLPYEGMIFSALLSSLFTPALDSLINSRRRRKNF
jgi:Na+-translocating ferredoxin:NAD+ oxidoreductase RnfD subunit